MERHALDVPERRDGVDLAAEQAGRREADRHLLDAAESPPSPRTIASSTAVVGGQAGHADLLPCQVARPPHVPAAR